MFSMCLPDHTCAQPFPLTATKTGNVSFNSSIEFVNGGILNSNITQLELKKLGSTGSEDQTLYQWCDGANCGSAGGRIDVEMSSPHNLAPTLLTLRDLNASDAGQYRITVRTVSVPGEGFTRMSIDFNLTVDGKSLMWSVFSLFIFYSLNFNLSMHFRHTKRFNRIYIISVSLDHTCMDIVSLTSCIMCFMIVTCIM